MSTVSSVTVSYERIDSVVVISIDRAGRSNSVDLATATALREAWERFAADPQAAVGILTGAGGIFSAGADLKSFDLIDHPSGFLGFTRMTVDKPTIAAIEGYCVAGGLELALWCDLRVCGEGATFGFFERRFGVPLVDGGTQRLPKVVGLGRALDLILTGRAVDAAEAAAIGLVNRVVPDGNALATARSLAASIAGFPQLAVRSDRAAVYAGLGMTENDGLAKERELGLSAITSAAKGAARFASGEGRQGRPIW